MQAKLGVVRRSFGEPYAHELPAGRGREEVAVARANVASGGGARASAEHQLVAHELAVVLADRTRGGNESGIGDVGTRCPLPDVAEPLRVLTLGRRRVEGPVLKKPSRVLESRRPGRDLPLFLSGKPRPTPPGEGVGFEVTDVTHRSRRVGFPHALV